MPFFSGRIFSLDFTTAAAADAAAVVDDASSPLTVVCTLLSCFGGGDGCCSVVLSSSSFRAIRLAAWSSTLSFSLVGLVGTFMTADVFDLVGVWNRADDVTVLLLFLVPDDVEGEDGKMDLVESALLLPLVETLPLLSLLLSFVFAVFPLSVVLVVVDEAVAAVAVLAVG